VFKLSFRPGRLPTVPVAFTGTDGVAVLGGNIRKPYEFWADLGLALSPGVDLVTEILELGAGEELLDSDTGGWVCEGLPAEVAGRTGDLGNCRGPCSLIDGLGRRGTRV